MARPRTKQNAAFPPNLMARPRGGVTYYLYRDPRTGKEASLQCPGDLATAIKRTQHLNSLIARDLAEKILRDIAGTPAGKLVPFDAWAVRCLKVFEDRGLAKATIKSRKSLYQHAIRAWSTRPLTSITVKDCADLQRGLVEQGKARSALALRSALVELFKEAQQSGDLPHGAPNPAEITKAPEVIVKRARLILEDFLKIRAEAAKMAGYQGTWVENSMLLALISGQRRDDIARLQFRRGADWQPMWMAYQADRKRNESPYPFLEDDHLWVIQGKTGALVRIPLSLHLDVFDLSLADIVKRCRSTRVASQYVIHHDRPFGNAPVGSAIHVDTISRQFGAARDATDLRWEFKTPPTFHELRSLSERLYREQGVDVQTLLGHTTEKMTRVYDDVRQAAWKTIKVS